MSLLHGVLFTWLAAAPLPDLALQLNVYYAAQSSISAGSVGHVCSVALADCN
jgi:multisubunit Na+/H+ antiporter MnhB subunit